MDQKDEQIGHKEVTSSQKIVELEEHEAKGNLWQVIKLPWWEFVLVLLLLGATISMFVLKNRLPEASGILIGVLVTSALLGLWLAFRPSEWAVDGLDNIMRYAGLTAYVAGVISSLASNLPEAVAAGILLVKGSSTGNSELITTAFYTTLSAAGFNAILLGIVVLIGGKKKGYIEIRKETIMAEGVLLRWGFVATLLTFGIAVVEMLEQIFENIGKPWYYRDEELIGDLPRLAGIALVVSYIIYIVYLIIKSRESKAVEQYVEPRATKPTRSKLDEKMLDTLKTQDVEITDSAHRKILDTPEEINIIDSECPQREETYRGSGKSIENPYIIAPTLERPHLKIGAASILVLLGITGIAGGGYLLSTAVESMLHTTHIEVGIAALIIGFSGAVPEHGIAVVAASKGKTDVALGNILGGMLQMTLLVFGAFAAIVKAPIDGFMLFQIIALAGIIWFVKRSISDDHKLTSFEGIMIILAQLFSFLLLLGELTGLKDFLF